jgi:hypothetical protein
LIDGCDLVFLAKSKDGDYHQEMNSVVFLELFENQLMPALKNPCLVVLDNVSSETLTRSRQSNPHFRVPACKTIKRLPLPEGIFAASDPSFESHM